MLGTQHLTWSKWRLKVSGKYQLRACRGCRDDLFPLVESAPEEIRTPNLLIRSQMLYPLSYGRLSSVVSMAEARGFEPPVPLKGDNSLAVSPIRPLWHASLDFLRVPDPVPGIPEPPEA